MLCLDTRLFEHARFVVVTNHIVSFLVQVHLVQSHWWKMNLAELVWTLVVELVLGLVLMRQELLLDFVFAAL